MIKHPDMSAKTTISNVDEDMVQMHAIDIRLNNLYELRGNFLLDEDKRQHREQILVQANEDGYFVLEPHTAYAFDTPHTVCMASGELAEIKPRSTLTRNGIICGSAIYDAGYNGGVNGYIANMTQYRAYIKVGTRIGQFPIYDAETYKLYEGVYNGK